MAGPAPFATVAVTLFAFNVLAAVGVGASRPHQFSDRL